MKKKITNKRLCSTYDFSFTTNEIVFLSKTKVSLITNLQVKMAKAEVNQWHD